MTPRIEDDGAILVMFVVQQSRLIEQSAPPEDKKAGSGGGGIQPKMAMLKWDSIARVPTGKSVVSVCQRSDKDAMKAWIVVTAKVVDAK